ncbi:autotransporter outer membrane beta-barrel domain-containing protein [Pseudomonas sp. Marseille-Q1929]|uniref:autotransporter family protein n=1 Tax=Pseudomonas sp. Marseille-Q1929 TaxID=2730402 RepID=UPI001A907879|nr:autotransporter outer membrane beta-barrel domain-containing protein [Pseudomonas sp. Marseille-Q1929]MBO0494404.1 autotransporter outer membrane beta-barrel domain-containing protein [Pseudomonas sp. Marseille-Q1929]
MRGQIPPTLYLSLATSVVLAAWPLVAPAACVVTPAPTGQVFTCTSGTDPGITALTGDNEVLFPSGDSVINGNVALGPGNDLVQLDAPDTRINGSVNMGDGVNIFRLNKGTITGAVNQGSGTDIAQISGGQAGAISQGAGVDRFAMSGGTIASLAQGDGHDTFNMSGGTITDAFEDGDDATMTGGSIGRVDMKLDNNLFDMRGGTIIRNLVTGFGNDTIRVSGTSVIGGNISTSGGTDSITVTGGTIGGQILASAGEDHFSWIGGGQIRGFVLMGNDNDTALIQNLTEASLATTPLIDGGTGTDTLTFDNTQAATPGRYTNWEQVTLDNNATFTLGGTFVLGDTVTQTGTMTLNGSSSLLVDTGIISPFTAGQQVTLNNAGSIDMTTGSSTATDSLTVNGNYSGNNGKLLLQSVLGADGSPSDKLVVSQGTLQGSTAISVSNLGGAGAATLQDGIQVVQATNGASGSAGAFTLAGPVSAGAFDYRLFKGGVTAGTAENYYLRSTVPVTPPDPVIIVPLPSPSPDEPPLPPNPGITPIPIYRPEVPIYAALLPAAQQIVQGMLGTYHERMGDQGQQQGDPLRAGWGRVYGSSSRQSFAGTVNPTLNSSITGFQVGSDLYTHRTEGGTDVHTGFFVGHSRLRGDIKGFNGGWQDNNAGNTTLRGDSLGAYLTLIAANQAYLDVVLMGTRLDGHNESDRGVKMDTRGHNVAASAEVGRPFQATPQWVVEPQAQLIVGKTKLDRQNDGVSDVAYKADTTVTSRLGIRLRGDYQVSGMPLQPYARANIWHTRGGQNTVTFADVTDIDTEQKSTTLGVSLGANLTVAPGVSLYSEVGFNRNLDSNALNGRQGTLGLRMAF